MHKTPNRMVAEDFLATIPGVQDDDTVSFLIDCGEDAIDCYNDKVSTYQSKDTMFSFGENGDYVILVQDGKVTAWLEGGFEDNRGEEMSWDYTLNGSDHNTSGQREADYEISKVYDDLYEILRANPLTDKL